MDTNNNSAVNAPIKRTVLDYNDIVEIAPQARGHEKLVNRVLHWLSVDKVNDVHDRYCDKPGPEFARNLLKDFDINLRIDGKEVLDNLPEGAFITVSNHPFGALDGISLIAMMGSIRPSFKVMVNMVLNHISAMRPNFIAVDALASDDPAKKAVSMKGIKGSHNAGTPRKSHRILPRRSRKQNQRQAAHRGPRMATFDHTTHPATQRACDTYIFPRSQQPVVQHSRHDKLATAHIAPSCRSVAQMSHYNTRIGGRHHNSRGAETA